MIRSSIVNTNYQVPPQVDYSPSYSEKALRESELAQCVSD